MKKTQLKCSLVACLIVLTLIIHISLPYTTFKMIIEHPELLNNFFGTFVYLITSSVLFVILNSIAAFGLFKLKSWSFKVTYLAIICATFAGVSYLPLSYNNFYHLFLSQPSLVPTIIINLVLLAYVKYLHTQYSKMSK